MSNNSLTTGHGRLHRAHGDASVETSPVTMANNTPPAMMLRNG
jgi:hypothetical protein